jgi:hypothetical protein
MMGKFTFLAVASANHPNRPPAINYEEQFKADR